MRALVTGAGGFVGANLARHLLTTGHEPIAAVRPGGDRWRLADRAAQFAIQPLDLRDPAGIAQVIGSLRPDVVFHLAAHGAYSWQTDLDSMLAVNVRATAAILEAAGAIGARVVHAGSSSEYGFRDAPSKESDRLEPNSHYAVTKAAATHLCSLAAARQRGSAVTLRLYSIYGPWEEPGRLMPTLVARAMRGEYPPLVAPDTARDFVWVGDACEALVAAASSDLDTDVVNVASGRQTTLGELVQLVRSQFAVPGEPAWGEMEQRRWDTSCWVGDPSLASDTLQWRARTSLSQGLTLLSDWIRNHPGQSQLYDPARPAPVLAGTPRDAGAGG